MSLNNPNSAPSRFTRWLIHFVLNTVANVTVIGDEKVPRDGSFIIAANHIGRLDAVLIYQFSDREDVILFVAEKYRKVPFIPWFAKHLNAIWIDRFNADFAALREALARLKNGGVMVLAPEGTRSPSASLQKAKPGVSFLAMKAGVQIFPVSLVGSEDSYVVSQLKRFRRANITIRVGDPFILPPVSGKDRDAALDRYTDEIMCQIGALLPPAYRGVYAEHPRLAELLAEKPFD